MVTQCPHKRLHGVEPGTHGAGAPLVEKPSCPPGRCVVPEVVERLLQKMPLQQNLWVSSGSGSRPSWW